MFNRLTHYRDFIHSTLKLPYIFNVLLSMLRLNCIDFFLYFFILFTIQLNIS